MTTKEIRISETSPNLFINAVIEQVKKGNTFLENTFYTGRTAHNVVFLEEEVKETPKPTKAPTKPRKVKAKVNGGSSVNAG